MEDQVINGQEAQENPNQDPVKEEPKKERKLTKIVNSTVNGVKKGWAKVKKPVKVVLTIGAGVVAAAVVGGEIERRQSVPVELPEGSIADIPESNTETSVEEMAD